MTIHAQAARGHSTGPTSLAPPAAVARTTPESSIIGHSLVAAREEFLANSEIAELALGERLVASRGAVTHAWFPIEAVLSTVLVLRDGSATEVSMTGAEGFAPLAAYDGLATSREQVVVQSAGSAHRIEAGALRAITGKAVAFDAAMRRYRHASYIQTAQHSACGRRHSVEQRTARWLLGALDRIVDDIPVTHLFLSQMLGVRRSSVTIVAEALRDAGAITYTRGRVRVTDRDALLARSCGCYTELRQSYDEILGAA